MTAVVGSSCMASPTEEQGGCGDFFLCRLATLRNSDGRNQALTRPDRAGELVGTCPAMRQVDKEIALVAARDFPLIITGERSTGKELVARVIHVHSDRASPSFLALNAATIPEALLESELLGDER